MKLNFKKMHSLLIDSSKNTKFPSSGYSALRKTLVLLCGDGARSSSQIAVDCINFSTNNRKQWIFPRAIYDTRCSYWSIFFLFFCFCWCFEIFQFCFVLFWSLLLKMLFLLVSPFIVSNFTYCYLNNRFVVVVFGTFLESRINTSQIAQSLERQGILQCPSYLRQRLSNECRVSIFFSPLEW